MLFPECFPSIFFFSRNLLRCWMFWASVILASWLSRSTWIHLDQSWNLNLSQNSVSSRRLSNAWSSIFENRTSYRFRYTFAPDTAYTWQDIGNVHTSHKTCLWWYMKPMCWHRLLWMLKSTAGWEWHSNGWSCFQRSTDQSLYTFTAYSLHIYDHISFGGICLLMITLSYATLIRPKSIHFGTVFVNWRRFQLCLLWRNTIYQIFHPNSISHRCYDNYPHAWRIWYPW